MIWLVLYCIVSIFHLIATGIDNITYIMISKVFLMPLLIIYAFSQIKIKGRYIFLILGLFFSWLGDIFLMFPREQYSDSTKMLLFIAGLSAFLIAHIQYIILFLKDLKNKIDLSLITSKPYTSIPFIIFGIGLLWFLYPHLAVMKIPVTLYAITIIAMLMLAFNRKGFVSSTSYILVFIGAILFVLSDSTIAITLFYKHFALDRLVIMSTYIVAQLLITYGVIVAAKSKPSL